MAPQVRYQLRVLDPRGHLLGVRVSFVSPPEPLEVALPIWTPGSYLVREHARHLEGMTARAGDEPLAVEKVRKNGWRISHGGAPSVDVEYVLYAHERTVRTNHLDEDHLVVCGAAAFVLGAHARHEPATLTVDVPSEWTLVVPLDGEGRTFEAPDYDALIDAPIYAGTGTVRAETIAGRPFTLVHHGPAPRADRPALARDVRRIVETETALLGGAPWDRYALVLLDDAPTRGGLEHENGAALTLGRGAYDDRGAVLDTLSLVAHEVLHAWNVKRIRPAALTPYDYDREQYTRALWWFEGGTSYFDHRILRLSGVCAIEEWLGHLGAQIGKLEETPGRLRQSLAEASFDAWIKAYRPDESTADTAVSYYLKGEVVCLLLDATIRVRTGGARCLDDALVALWERFGRTRRPVSDADLEATLGDVAGGSLADVLDPWVRGTGELPVDAVLAGLGLLVERHPGRRGALGVKSRTEHGRVVLTSVLRGRPGHAAGLAAGDEILAVDGVRVEGRLDRALARKEPLATVSLVVDRRGHVRTVEATLDGTPAEKVRLVPTTTAPPATRALREAFLREAPRGRPEP